MSVAVITGSAGLIGSEATRYFAGHGMDVVGIDNDMRRRFFGDEASTRWQRYDDLRHSACVALPSATIHRRCGGRPSARRSSRSGGGS